MPELGEIRKRDNKWHNKAIWQACEVCHKERWVQLVKGQPQTTKCHFCSLHTEEYRKRQSVSHTGEKSYCWKGGRKKNMGGYVLVQLLPNDFFYPMAPKSHYVLEHRLVMAKHLRRCLLPWEVVHHQNGIRDDNRLENLALLGANSQHNKILNKEIKNLQRQVKQLQARVTLLEAENVLLKAARLYERQ